MKSRPILEVSTYHSFRKHAGGVWTVNSRTSVFFLSLCSFLSLFCTASSRVFLDSVLCSDSHQPQLCKAPPFWEILLPSHVLACSSSPCHSPSLHKDLSESPLQEPSGESSPALTDCQKWPDVYMSVHFFGLATICLPGSC